MMSIARDAIFLEVAIASSYAEAVQTLQSMNGRALVFRVLRGSTFTLSADSDRLAVKHDRFNSGEN